MVKSECSLGNASRVLFFKNLLKYKEKSFFIIFNQFKLYGLCDKDKFPKISLYFFYYHR